MTILEAVARSLGVYAEDQRINALELKLNHQITAALSINHLAGCLTVLLAHCIVRDDDRLFDWTMESEHFGIMHAAATGQASRDALEGNVMASPSEWLPASVLCFKKDLCCCLLRAAIRCCRRGLFSLGAGLRVAEYLCSVQGWDMAEIPSGTVGLALDSIRLLNVDPNRVEPLIRAIGINRVSALNLSCHLDYWGKIPGIQAELREAY